VESLRTFTQLLPFGRFRVGVLLDMLRRQWLIRLRWFIVAAAAGVLALERLASPGFRRPPAIFWSMAALACVNLVWTALSRVLLRGLRDPAAVTPVQLRRLSLFANAQMTVDLVLLTVVLRYSGGIENPMAVFYLFHALIAILLLTPLNALLQGLWALLLYAGLTLGECFGLVRPHYPFLPPTPAGGIHTHLLYTLSSLAALAFGILGTLYFTHYISSRLDAHERALQEANEGLRRSQEAIRDLQARRSRFMQTAAHQLKSPLAAIETLATLILYKAVSPDLAEDVVRRIVNRARQATLQVTELLTLARVQEAEPRRHHAACAEVNEIARQVAESYADQARSRKIAMQVATDACEDAYAAVDPRDLTDCVGNLVDNAIKYTDEGGSVRVAVTCTDEEISLTVQDTGMGIAEGTEDDIFDPFRRGQRALERNIPGTGLGLAIVREVAEQAGGRIAVRSAPGKGSEFVLTFPRRVVQEGPPAVRSTRATTLRSDAAPPEGEEKPPSH
jgi:signal transduction histidine kinase